MQNKKIKISILIILAVIFVMFFVFLSTNKYVIATLKYKVLIDKPAKILYFDNKIFPDTYCYASIKVDNNAYAKLLKRLEKAGYSEENIDDHIILLDFNSNWVDSQQNITNVYTLFTVKYRFFQGIRIHIYVYITEPCDGYRTIYFLRHN